MAFKCGIIGLPNVGKSTLFKALTNANIAIANFPFCTIEPNTGMVSVPDLRLEQLASIVKTKKVIPTTIEFIDIAGLIKGASKGEGLGNQFLAKIRDTDAILHVVRCFNNAHILHITGEICPEKDINIINTELIFSDLEICERILRRIHKQPVKSNSIMFQLTLLEKVMCHLKKIKILRTLSLSHEEKKVIHEFNFLTLKPTIYVANISEEYQDTSTRVDNPYLNKVKLIASSDNAYEVVAIYASVESERTQNYFKNGSDTGLHRIIRASYRLLNMTTFFTTGKKEVRAWTIPSGSTAFQAAGKIHTDFQKGFIRAKVISFTDFITYHGEKNAKYFGKLRSEGKDYIVQDGDIIEFLFNV